MNIRTKVITTIIAMVCSLSVSAAGIVTIMLDFSTQVANTTRLTLGDVQGDLYGSRIGANNFDFDKEHYLHLFKNGDGVQEAEMNLFCQDVSFSVGSTKIEYVFKFVLSSSADNGVLVKLEDGSLTNSVTYKQSYLYAYGQTEPNWATAENMQVGISHVVSEEQPYLWLKASLEMNKDVVQRIGSDATWSFSYTFTGITVE